MSGATKPSGRAHDREFSNDETTTALTIEFSALRNHRRRCCSCDVGHAEIVNLVENYIERLDPRQEGPDTCSALPGPTRSVRGRVRRREVDASSVVLFRIVNSSIDMYSSAFSSTRSWVIDLALDEKLGEPDPADLRALLLERHPPVRLVDLGWPGGIAGHLTGG